MVWVCSVVSDSLQPHGLQPASSSVQARRACHFFLQGVFLTQGLNPCLQGLLLYRRLVYCWATSEVPKFHTLLCKCSHCFATEDTSILTTKLPESHTHDSAKVNHKIIQIKVLCKRTMCYLLCWLCWESLLMGRPGVGWFQGVAKRPETIAIDVLPCFVPVFLHIFLHSWGFWV